MRKLVIGCGYLGRRVADVWLADGHSVWTISRRSKRAAALTQAGIHCCVADVLQPETLRTLPEAETVLYAVGWDRRAGVPIRDVYVSGLQNVLAHLPSGTSRFIYVSSTGVYGQTDGCWVDEQSVCQPARLGGRACLEAEQTLRQHPLGKNAIVLRMAGIYGPGRIPRRRQLASGLPITVASEGFLNLIHVQDAARIVIAAEEQLEPPSLLCVSDGQAVVRGDYYRELARLIGASPPHFATPTADAPVSDRASSSKRVSNRRMLDQLTIRLQYPSYREGLAAICSEESDANSGEW